MFTPEVKSKILTLMEKYKSNNFTIDYDDSELLLLEDSAEDK